MGLEEVKRAIRKLKKGKAAGEDGIQNEAWLWGGQGVKRAIREICRRVWGREVPERWKDGVIVLIAKKRRAERVEDYRGVTLMPTAYKIYAMVLTERLRGEMEEKGMLPEGQAGKGGDGQHLYPELCGGEGVGKG